MMTYLAWMAVRLVSLNREIRYASAASWRAIMIGKQCPESIIALPVVYKPMQDLSVEW